MKSKVAVQWAASIASVFWGVWWTSFIKEIVDSELESFTASSITISKNYVLIALVIWGVLFAVAFVRWLARVQNWGLETDLGKWLNNSRALILHVSIIVITLRNLQILFSLKEEIIIYGITLVLLWPFAPFIVAIWPDERR